MNALPSPPQNKNLIVTSHLTLELCVSMETHNHRWNPVDSVYQQFCTKLVTCSKSAGSLWEGCLHELYRLHPATFFTAEQPMFEDDDPVSVSVHASMIVSSPEKFPHLITRSPLKSVVRPLTCASIQMSVTLAIYLIKLLSHRCRARFQLGRQTCTHLLHHHHHQQCYNSFKEFNSVTFIFYDFSGFNAKSATLNFNNP